MPLQLGGSGYRPAEYQSPYKAEQAQLEKQAASQALRMQQMSTQYQMNAQRDSRANSLLAQHLGQLSEQPIDTNIMYNSIEAGNFSIDPATNRFSTEAKQYAWDQYSRQAANPNYATFQTMWKQGKQQYDSKVLQDIEMDMRAGRISSSKFNKVFRDPAFATYMQQSGASDEMKNQFIEQTGYDPSYRTWGETLNPMDTTSAWQENPVTMGAIASGFTIPTIALVGREKTLNERLSYANKLIDKVKGRQFESPVNPRTNKPFTPRSKAYQEALKKWQNKQQIDISRVNKIANKIGDKRLMGRAASLVEKAKKFNMLKGAQQFGLGVGRFTLGAKAGGAAGRLVGGETGEAVGSVAGGFAGNWTVGKVVKALTHKKSRDALLLLLKKTSPKLATKIAPKLALSLVGTGAPELVSTAFGLGGLAWTAYDIAKALNND